MPVTNVIWAPTGSYGYLGLGAGPDNGLIIPAWGSGVNLYIPGGNLFASAPFPVGDFSDRYGFGVLLANAWGAASASISWSNGKAYAYPESGTVPGPYFASGTVSASPSACIVGVSPPLSGGGVFYLFD